MHPLSLTLASPNQSGQVAATHEADAINLSYWSSLSKRVRAFEGQAFCLIWLEEPKQTEGFARLPFDSTLSRTHRTS